MYIISLNATWRTRWTPGRTDTPRGGGTISLTAMLGRKSDMRGKSVSTSQTVPRGAWTLREEPRGRHVGGACVRCQKSDRLPTYHHMCWQYDRSGVKHRHGRQPWA